MQVTLIDDATIAVTDAYAQRAALRALDGARWVAPLRAWLLDATAPNALGLSALGPLPPEVAALVPRREQRVVEDTGEWLTRATPYEHQRRGVAGAMEALTRGGGGYFLLFEMGCGKTLAALEVASRLHAAGEVSRVLVICPGAVVPVWAREAAQYLDTPHEVAELLGPKAKRIAALRALSGRLQIAAVNVESSWRIDELVGWADLLIIDESQRIKGHSSKQSKGVARIARECRYRLGLTGTPVTNGPLDIWAQYRAVAPRIFAPSYYAHRARYAVMETGYSGAGTFKRVVGYQRLDELAERAHTVAYRVTKADALDLPETVDTVVPVHLSDRTQRAYTDLERESVAAFAGGECSVTNVLTRLLRLSQVTSGYVPRDDGEVETLGTEKLDAACEVIADAIDGGGKAVAFCRFTREVEYLLERFGQSAVGLHGAVPDTDRAEAVRRFQDDDDVRVMVAQLQVGGAGITLTAASTMVFVSLSYNAGDYEQAKARIHRIGQAEKCTYVHLVAEGTVDETVLDALRAKRSVAEMIVDRYRR